MRERDMGYDAAPEEGVVRRLLGAVEELINDDDVTRLVFFLQRADGADADDPLNAKLFHGPDVGPMVQFARQNPMTASMAREKNHVTPGKFAGEQIVGGIAERRFDLHPFLVGEAFKVVKSGAADDA